MNPNSYTIKEAISKGYNALSLELLLERLHHKHLGV